MQKLAMFALLPILAIPVRAHAFCRTTTCRPEVSCEDAPDDCCKMNEQGCDENGAPVYWPTSCVPFQTHSFGSSNRDITGEALQAVVSAAFDTWLSTKCTGGPPSIAIESHGLTSCASPGYAVEDEETNSNLWHFAKATGEEIGEDFDLFAYAVTTSTINRRTAEIYDMDVELNSTLANFTIGDQVVDIDLASIVTHEAGHFLGLEHSHVVGATMSEMYEDSSVHLRNLSADDQAAICTVYPPLMSSSSYETCATRGRGEPVCQEHAPRGGCNTARAPYTSQIPQQMLFSLVFVSVLLRRRRTSGRYWS